MRVLDLALKDLLQIVRDWKAAFFLLIMPVAFTLLFGFAFGGFDTGETDPRLPVGILDQDGSVVSESLQTLLADSAVIRPVADAGDSVEALEAAVGDEDLVAAVIIPAGVGDSYRAGEPQQLTVIAGSGTGATTAENEIQAIANRLDSAVTTARLSTNARAEQQPFADDDARRAFFDDSLTAAVAAWQDPPITVAARAGTLAADTGTAAEEEGFDNAFAHSAPGMMLQFAIAGLIGAAEVLVAERKSRTLRRLLTTAISKAQILLGHFLAMFIMILAQLLVLITFGQLVLQLDYFAEPLATLLLVVPTALFAASLGLLIGAVARNSDQVVIFALIPMFVLAGLGGAWVPLEFTGETFQTIGHLSPVAWAMDGFKDILIRGLGVEAVLLPAGVLLLYAALCFALAVWRFRFE